MPSVVASSYPKRKIKHKVREQGSSNKTRNKSGNNQTSQPMTAGQRRSTRTVSLGNPGVCHSGYTPSDDTHLDVRVPLKVQAETDEWRFAACVCKKKRGVPFRPTTTNCIEKTSTARKRKRKKTDLHRLGPRRPHVPDVEAPVPVASAGHVPPARRDGRVHQAAEGFLLVLPLPLHPAGGVDQRRWLPRVHAARRDTGVRLGAPMIGNKQRKTRGSGRFPCPFDHVRAAIFHP